MGGGDSQNSEVLYEYDICLKIDVPYLYNTTDTIFLYPNRDTLSPGFLESNFRYMLDSFV